MGVVFETATPFDTPRKSRELVEWFHNAVRTNQHHILILIAVFIVHFLAIHPFQDGNGRLSRIHHAPRGTEGTECLGIIRSARQRMAVVRGLA